MLRARLFAIWQHVRVARPAQLFVGLCLVWSVAALMGPRVVLATELGSAARGVPVRFERVLDTRLLRARGRLLTLGLNHDLPNPLGRQTATVKEPTLLYSPRLDVVFEIGGPGYIPYEHQYYLYDGTYLVYDPPSFDNPSWTLRAVPREYQQQELIREQRQRLYESQTRSVLGSSGRGAQDGPLTFTVPITMPGALKEVFGRGATNIRVSGSENIRFAGESRRVSDFRRQESGRGQSLFPRLDMEQNLQVKLEGTIGDKVHVQVDHNSSAFGTDANRINIYYEGYDDDIVRRIDLGGTNLNLPGSQLVSFGGSAQGLFGVKSTMRLGGLDLTVIASKEEADVETRTLTPSGSSARPTTIDENRFARDRFFFYEQPDTTDRFYDTYGINPDSLIRVELVSLFQVFIDTGDQNVIERQYRGYAVEGLPPGQPITQAYFNSRNENDRYPPGQYNADPETQGKWKLIPREDLGFVILELAPPLGRRVLGFYLRQGRVGANDAIGVSFQSSSTSQVGSPGSGTDQNVQLRLIRNPRQVQDFYAFKTNRYMMRHVYALGTTNLDNLEVSIRSFQALPGQNPDTPRDFPQTTYLHMFGLDEQNDSGAPQPDGFFDLTRPNLLDPDDGFLFLPGTRPFSPPHSIVVQRLRSAFLANDEPTTNLDSLASVFIARETSKLEALYTLAENDQDLPRQVLQIESTSTGTGTEIVLPSDIIEGSEVVRLDGRALQRGVDYDIESFAGGRITFKGQTRDEITSSSRIEVSYQFRPLFGGGKSTLLGMSGQYNLGRWGGRLATVWLYESTGGLTRRPKLGEEPTRTLIGDLNAGFQFQPRWMTGLMNVLPFTDASAPSSFNINAEAAISIPDPNTRNEAFVDDLEGADDSDEQNLSRSNWNWASVPLDSLMPRDHDLRVPVAFYNPFGEVKRGHLFPNLSENERRDGLSVLELGFDRAKAQQLDAMASDPSRPWSGVMRAFRDPLDLSRTKSIEVWINDYRGSPENRRGRMHIDFGDLSEDFVFIEEKGETTPGYQPFLNREAPQPLEFDPDVNDLGWDGEPVASPCDAQNPPPSFESECYLPEVRNAQEQHYLANGTEDNRDYDTEDINANSRFEQDNSYFSISLDLADTTFVVTDVAQEFAGHELEADFHGWRKYRIDLDRAPIQILSDPGLNAPSLRQIRFLRIWFEDTPSVADTVGLFENDIQLYGLRLTRNNWRDVGVFAVDSTRVEPAATEKFTLGVINFPDDINRYVLPPDGRELDAQGIQAREQSLLLDFSSLEAGHEMLAERTLTQRAGGFDFTTYRLLTYFVHYPTTHPDSAEFFFRIGRDTLNYYEVAHVVPSRRPWMEINVNVDDLTGLKFPEDYPGPVEVQNLTFGAQQILQVSANIVDVREPPGEPDLVLRVTRRGEPSLKNVSRLFVGVRQVRDPPEGGPSPSPVSGEVWFNNVRLEEVVRDIGVAQNYSFTGRFSDVLDVSGGLNMRNADFRALRQRTGGGQETIRMNGRLATELSKLVPTAGLTIPISYEQTRDRSLPKFFSQSDTRNTNERKQEQRTETKSTRYGFSISKKPSKHWINRVTLDGLRFSYNETQNQRRTFTTRDTSSARSRNIQYSLSPKDRGFQLGQNLRLNLMPNNVTLALQHSSSQSTNYKVNRRQDPNTGAFIDSLIRTPASPKRSLNLSASMAMRPLPFLSARYNFNEPRDYRNAHPRNEAERLRIFGVDLGLPVGRSEGLSIDLTPRRFRFSYTANFTDRRTTTVGLENPDTHNSSTNRSRRLSFDLGLHRRVLGWILPDPKRPEPRRAVADTLETEAAPDTLPKRGAPNPILFVLRRLSQIEPIKVEYSDSRAVSYTGLPNEPSALFRYGFITRSGFMGFDTPPRETRRNAIDLTSAVPLFAGLRITTRYKRDSNVTETTSGDLVTEIRTLNTTFPSFDLNIGNIQEWRILRLLGDRLERSNISFGFSRAVGESKTLLIQEVVTEGPGSRESERLAGDVNWTGQWRGNMSTSLTFKQTIDENTQSGSRRRGVDRSVQASTRFRLAPEGGLKLPFVRRRLKSGMDVSFNTTYNTRVNDTFNNINNPGQAIRDTENASIAFSVRGDYTLSRSMNGGVELAVTRNSTRRAPNKQTATTVRIGSNLTFLF